MGAELQSSMGNCVFTALTSGGVCLGNGEATHAGIGYLDIQSMGRSAQKYVVRFNGEEYLDPRVLSKGPPQRSALFRVWVTPEDLNQWINQALVVVPLMLGRVAPPGKQFSSGVLIDMLEPGEVASGITRDGASFSFDEAGAVTRVAGVTARNGGSK